jgi:hypothetical protein
MNALYGLYADAEGAQRAADSLRAASSELKFDPQQIVIVSGEPHEGSEPRVPIAGPFSAPSPAARPAIC